MREGQNFSATEENINIKTSKRKGKQSQENILMKQQFCRCRPIKLKSRCCAKVHRSVVETIRNVTKQYEVGFEVLTAVSMKIAVFWVVAPCRLLDVYQRFRGPCCLHHQGDE
jgi:hypothetical protein